MKKILTILFLMCLMAVRVEAQIFLEEGKVQETVSGGETVTGTLSLHNTTERPVKVRVYWEDFLYVAPYDGSKQFLPAGTTEVTLRPWVTFSPAEFSLMPFSKRQVDYSIKVPAEFDKGRYGVLFFEKEPDIVEGEKGVTVVTRVGSLFFIEPLGEPLKASLNDIQIVSSVFHSRFENQSELILIPEGVYYIMDEGGLIADRGEIPKVYLPAEATTNYNFGFSPELESGNYTLVITVNLGNNEVLVKEISFKKMSPTDYQILEVRD